MKFLRNLFLASICTLLSVACNNATEASDASLELMYVPTVVSFKSEETKTYLVQSENVAKIEVTAPAGWTASCTTEMLTITAPKQGAAGIDEEGEVEITYSGSKGSASITSAKVKLAVDTRPVLTFELSVSDIRISDCKITCIPSRKDITYYCNIITAETYAKYEGNVAKFCADQLKLFQNHYDTLPLSQVIEGMTDKGDIIGDTAKNLPAATDFYMFAITADEETGEAYGDPVFIQFTTLPPGKPEDCVLTIEINTLRSNYVQADVLSTDSSVGYWFYYEDARQWTTDEDMAARVKADMEAAAPQFNMSLADMVNAMSNYGDVSDQFTDLEAGTDYILYAFAMDDAGNIAGPMFKKAFTTPLTDLSDADIEMEYKYFDGDAVAAAKPDEYGKYSGQNRYLLQVKSTKNPYTYFWAVGVLRGDATDSEKYPDTQTYAAMMMDGSGAKYGLEITEVVIPKTDTQCTVLGFALDSSGSYGPLHRILVNLSADGISPVSELYVSTGGDATPAAASAPIVAADFASAVSGVCVSDEISRRLGTLSDQTDIRNSFRIKAL